MKVFRFRGVFPLCVEFRVVLSTGSLLLGVAFCLAGGIVSQPTEAALRAALVGGGSVTFECDGTIPITTSVTSTSDTVLDGTGREVILAATNAIRVLFVHSNVSFTLRHVTIADGRSTNGGGLFNDGGKVDLIDSSFVNNLATNLPFMPFTGDGCGGAILNQGGTINATNCTFVGNAATQTVVASESRPFLGGAICSLAGAVTIHRCRFTDNSASGLSWNQKALTGSGASGGAIYSGQVGTLVVEQCSFFRNVATAGRGGDGYVNSISDGGPGGSGGEGQGGAIVNLGVMVLSKSLFASNVVTGGLGGQGGPGGAIEGAATYNGGPGGTGGNSSGGGLQNGGAAQLINCTFAGNTAAGGRGGPGGWPGYNPYPSPHWGQPGPGGTEGDGVGGAICTTNAQIALTNGTVAFNSSAAGSSGTTRAGGIQDAGGALLNTLLASNAPANVGGTVLDAGYNLSSDGSCPFWAPGSRNNLQMRIGPLSNNGGPTLTIPLLPQSPAIDGGITVEGLTTDQRDFPRQLGNSVDIGAYEYGIPLLGITLGPAGGFDISVSSALPGPCSLLLSPDLLNWSAIATNSVGPSGETVFHHDPQSFQSTVFYRSALVGGP